MTNTDQRIAAKPGTTVKAYVIRCGQLRLRRMPTVDSSIVLQLLNGEKVFILAKEADGWFKVRTKNGETGYAMSSYLEVC